MTVNPTAHAASHSSGGNDPITTLGDLVGGDVTVDNLIATGGDVTADTFTPTVVAEITGEMDDADLTTVVPVISALLAALEAAGLITDSTTLA